jgi:hypothetical protein
LVLFFIVAQALAAQGTEAKKSRECCNYNANDGTCRKATVLIPFHRQWNWNAPTFCVSHPAFTDDDQYYQKITMANRMLFDGMLFVAH